MGEPEKIKSERSEPENKKFQSYQKINLGTGSLK